MTAYIVFCALYRVACGALLLVIGWRLASGGNADALALATLMSFVPALLVPLLFKTLPAHWIGRGLSSASLAALAGMSAVVSRTLDDKSALVVLVFLLWLLFFTLEPLIEAWFTRLTHGMDDKRINHHSTVSMTLNQCCLMAGPVLAYQLAAAIGDNNLVALLAGLFLLLAVMNAFIMPDVTVPPGKKAPPVPDRSQQRRAILPLCLIWPVLGCFNFMVPLYFAQQIGGTMAQVGIVDAAMGIGMALAGVLSSSAIFTSRRKRNYASILLVLAGTLAWQASASSLAGYVAATALLGCGFGAMRIACRAYLARHFVAAQVAALVSRANAFSLLIISLSLLLSRYQLVAPWALPFALSLCMAAVLHLVFKDTNHSQGRINELS